MARPPPWGWLLGGTALGGLPATSRDHIYSRQDLIYSICCMSMPMHPGSIVRILEHLRHAIHFGGLIMPIASHGHAQFSDFRTVIMDDDPFPLVYHN
jgi:hypothetical protein